MKANKEGEGGTNQYKVTISSDQPHGFFSQSAWNMYCIRSTKETECGRRRSRQGPSP